jgi:hypothetical protein
VRPQSAKAKGRRAQQEVRDAILAAFPHLDPDDVRNTPMGTQGEDLLLSPAARKVWPWYTEIKNVEALNIHKAIAQASGKSRPPAVVFRKNATPLYVAIPLAEHLTLLQDAAAERVRRALRGTEGPRGAGQEAP